MNPNPNPFSEDEKLEILARVLQKHGKEILTPLDPIPDLDSKVSGLLNRTLFVRQSKRPYSKWLPMAALLLVGINATLFFEPLSTRQQGKTTPPLSLQEELSPFAQEGVMFSNAPILTQPGSEGEEMLVRVSTDPFPKTFKTRRKSIPWETTGLSPLDRGKRIQFYFSKPDERNPSAEAHSWYVLSAEQAAHLENLVGHTPGELEKAKILFRHYCYPEALHYATIAQQSARKQDTHNLEALKLIRDCDQKLGYKKDCEILEALIRTLESEKSDSAVKG